MIAEPYICIKGARVGEIHTLLKDGYKELWRPYLDGQTVRLAYCKNVDNGCVWQPYADHEREKLKELGEDQVRFGLHGFVLYPKNGMPRWSETEIRYGVDEYSKDSESSRLLNRAEFLREVCKREGVAWLLEENCRCLRSHSKLVQYCIYCHCSCHRIKKPKCCCSQSIAMGDNLFTKIICPFCPEHGHHKQHCPMPE